MEFYRALNRIYFPDVKLFIPKDRYFYHNGHTIMFPVPNGTEIDYGNDQRRLAFMKSSNYLEVITEEEYKTNLPLSFQSKPKVIKATYNESAKIVTTVPQDNRFEVINCQKAFERSVPTKTEQFLNSLVTSSQKPSQTKVTEVTEKYQKIDISASQEIKLPTVGEELQLSSPEDSPIKDLSVIPVDIPMTPLKKQGGHENTWDTFKTFTRKKDRLDFLNTLSYASVLGFLKDKLENCIVTGDVITGAKNQINLEKQYKEFIALLDKKISQSRVELKI